MYGSAAKPTARSAGATFHSPVPILLQGKGLVPSILGGLLGAVGTITDVIMDVVPASISRGVVRCSLSCVAAELVLHQLGSP